MEISLAQRREATLDSLTAYQPIWTGLKLRRERTLVTTRYGTQSGDPEVELSWQATNQHMDRLLDNYFNLVGGVELITPLDEVWDGRGSQ